MKTLAAYTEPKGTFPAYLNASEMENGDVKVICRNRRSSLPSEIVIPKAEWAKFVAGLTAPATPAKKPTTGIMKPK